MSGRSLGRAAAIAALLALGCNSTPAGAPAAADVLAAKTRGEMLQITTLEPQRCVFSRPGFEQCVWKLGDRNSAWYTLAESIDTRYRINLICEFAMGGGPRERDCVAIPAASPPTTGSSKRRVRISASEAQSQLDAAKTAWDLTWLVGDAPMRCSRVDDANQFCVWQATGHTRGFATLVRLLESRARVQLSCTLPADGSPRAAGSCRAEAF
jgi:hypothetical protein